MSMGHGRGARHRRRTTGAGDAQCTSASLQRLTGIAGLRAQYVSAAFGADEPAVGTAIREASRGGNCHVVYGDRPAEWVRRQVSSIFPVPHLCWQRWQALPDVKSFLRHAGRARAHHATVSRNSFQNQRSTQPPKLSPEFDHFCRSFLQLRLFQKLSKFLDHRII